MKEKYIEEFILAALALWTVCPVEIVDGKSVEQTTRVVTCTTTKYFKTEHSLIKSYFENGTAGWDIPHWNYYGSTVITSDFVRLTPDRPEEDGLLTNIDSFEMKNWEIQLQLKIHGNDNNNFTSYGRHGLAIWYTKNELKAGPAFGAQLDSFEGFAVVVTKELEGNVDTSVIYPLINSGFPEAEGTRRISPNNGTQPSQKCMVKIRNLKNGDSWLKIRYARGTLSVWTDVDGKKEWKHCFNVEHITLPTHYYLGLSASTNEIVPDNHDVIALKAYEIEFEGEQEENREAKKGQKLQDNEEDLCRQMAASDAFVTIFVVDEQARGPTTGLNVLIVPAIVLVAIVALCVAANQMYPNAYDNPNIPVRFR